MKAIKTIPSDMGGVVFCQNSAAAYPRFNKTAIDAARAMVDCGHKSCFPSV